MEEVVEIFRADGRRVLFPSAVLLFFRINVIDHPIEDGSFTFHEIEHNADSSVVRRSCVKLTLWARNTA